MNGEMKNTFLAGFAAVLALTGCSSESDYGTEPGGDVAGNGTAYMTVRISNVATRAAEGGFDQSKDRTEHDIISADFYFYDEAQTFVTRANVWNGGAENDGTGGNIEFNGNTVVALKGLSAKGFPKYVVTVLNCPQGFEPGRTLTEMGQLLAVANAADGGFLAGDKFIMSTSSYIHDGETPDFVTELTDDNFVNDPGQISTPVTIYVERLAAKVTMTIEAGADGATSPLVPVAGKEDTYEMKLTIAGGSNADTETDPDKIHVGAETMQIRFLGWTLNATAKKSLMMKHIKDWSNDELGFVWNVRDFFRSYWGMSYNYDDAAYTYLDAQNPEIRATDALNYTSYSAALENGAMRSKLSDAIYCAENTNTGAIVTSNPAGTITTALLFAEITDAEGRPLDLVRYNGMFFQEPHYIAYVLNNKKNLGGLNYYVKSEEGTTVRFDQVGTDDVEIVGRNGGYVIVKSKFDKDAVLYAHTGAGQAVEDYTQIAADEAGKTAVEQLDAELAGFNVEGSDAIAYKGGLMYYDIPIQHLNNPATRDPKQVLEAEYGVVRNHVYVLNITSLTNPGMGIFDPDEIIIPDDPFKEDKLYQVGADIKVLSWKIVEQNVEL